MKHPGIFFLLCIGVSGCSTFKGAMDPYSLAPKQSYDFSDVSISEKLKQKSFLEFIQLDENNEYSLAELIDIAMLNNPQTKISWADAKIAAAQYGESLQNYFPQLQADVLALREKEPVIGLSGFGSWNTFYQGQLSLSYLILDFGQTRATSYSALYTLQNFDLSHNRQIQSVIQTVMSNYYSLVYEQELLVAKEQDVENAQTSYDAASEKLKAGTGDVGDLMQATTYLLQTKLSLVQEKQNLHTATTTLTNNIGVNPIDNLKIQQFPSCIDFLSINSTSELLEEAKKMRPDYQAAIANVLSKEESVTAAFAKNYPTLTGDVQVGRTYIDGHSDDYDFSAQLTLNIPLFQGFYVQNSVKQAKSNLSMAEFQLQQLELSIEQEISNYREDFILSIESVQYAKEYLAAAEKDFKIQLDKYKAGTNTIVDLINAQTSVANARAKYVLSKKDYFTSLANVAYAIGSFYYSEGKLETKGNL